MKAAPRAGNLIRPAGALQAFLQIRKDVVRDLDLEGFGKMLCHRYPPFTLFDLGFVWVVFSNWCGFLSTDPEHIFNLLHLLFQPRLAADHNALGSKRSGSVHRLDEICHRPGLSTKIISPYGHAKPEIQI